MPTRIRLCSSSGSSARRLAIGSILSPVVHMLVTGKTMCGRRYADVRHSGRDCLLFSYRAHRGLDDRGGHMKKDRPMAVRVWCEACGRPRLQRGRDTPRGRGTPGNRFNCRWVHDLTGSISRSGRADLRQSKARYRPSRVSVTGPAARRCSVAASRDGTSA
jgi:hypothetical protein